MKSKLLILLLSGLKNKTLSAPCTRTNSTIIDCADYLIRHLKGASHE